MSASPEAAWSAIAAAAAARYRHVDGRAYRFARSKLRRDEAFRALLEQGAIPAKARVLDLGCGQGLLAALLVEAQRAAQQGNWPSAWPAAPTGARITGVDKLALDIARARAALGDDAEFLHDDMRYPPEQQFDVVVFLDTLHYVAPADQRALLERARARLRRGGRMLLRVHDDRAPVRAAFGRWVDRITAALSGGGFGSVHGRPVAEWCALLEGLGLSARTYRADGRAPFANRLIVASLLRNERDADARPEM